MWEGEAICHCSIRAFLFEDGSPMYTILETLAVQTRTAGADDEGALVTEGHLNALLGLEEYAEAGTLGRGMLEKMQRVHCRDSRGALTASANLVVSLLYQGNCVKAVEIKREVLVQKTRLLGAEHEETLITATNLALLFWQYGQKMECE